MVCVEGCWVANVNKLMFVLSGCCPGDIIKTTDHLHLPHLLAKYRLSFSFHHFSAPSYCLLIASSAAGWARFVKCDLRRKRFRLAMYWLTGRVRCGLGLGAHQEWVQMFPVVWNSAGSLHQRLHTALAPSADFWYRLTGRGGGGLLAAVPRAETTQPSPAAATRHTLKFRPSISIGLPICNADPGPRLG